MQGYRVPCSALLAPEPALNFRRGNHERCVSYFTLARNRCSPADPHADRRGAFCSLGTFLSVSACCPAQIDQQPHRRGSPEAHPRNENWVTAVPFRLLSPPATSLGSRRVANRSAIGPGAVVESEWPERTHKLPPKPKQG